jgi:TonB family protein
MSALLVYLLGSSLCVAVFYIVYRLLLSRDTFFTLNRFYLLGAVIFSLVFPLVPVHWLSPEPTSTMILMLEPVMITPDKVGKALETHMQWTEILTVAYLTGGLIFFSRFMLQLIQLYLITRRYGITRRNGMRVVAVDSDYAPFSFFNLAYINEARVPPGSLGSIFEHEQVHMRQLHSVDLVLFRLASVLLWFNPFVWLTAREMKGIHEYLADETLLQKGLSRTLYQQMILNETMGVRVNYLTNHFNVSLLKKRFAMMTKKRSTIWAAGKLLFVVPAMLALLFILTGTSYSNQSGAGGNPVLIPDNPSSPMEMPQDKPKAAKSEEKVYEKVDVMPTFPGGHEAMVKFLIQNIKYPETAKKNKVQGTVYVGFIVRASGAVTDVKVKRGVGSGCDEEAMRVVSLMPKWNPGTNDGKAVDVSFNLPIKFALDDKKKEETK